MGECGCSADEAMYRFEGASGVHFGLRVYDGCRYCGTPVAVDIYRYGDEFAADFLEGVPELPVQTYGEGIDGIAGINILEPVHLIAALKEAFGEDATLADLETGWAMSDALTDAVGKTLAEYEAGAREIRNGS